MHWKQARGRGTCQSYSLRLAARLTWSRRPGVTLFSIALPRHGPGARPPRGPPRRARANHMILDWLGVVVQALLFWCCSSTAMPVAGQRLPAAQLAAEAGPGKGQIWRSFPATSCMRMQWCLLWSKYSLSHKNIFSLEVYQNRGLVLTTTSDKSSISDNVNVNDWYKLIPKFNESAHFCKSGESSLAVSGCWILFSTILINRFF